MVIQLIPKGDVVSISQWKETTKAYKYEMRPTKNQEVKLNQTVNTCRHLYNDVLGERKDGWEKGGWNIQYNDQQNYLPKLRNMKNSNMLSKDDFGKELREVYAQVLQNVIKRVDTSYQNFFRRVKNNKTNSGNNNQYKKPGFPRFKGYGRYDSFTFPQYGNGADIRIYKSDKRNRRIVRLSKIGEIKYISHREIEGSGIPYRIKTITIKKEVDKWFVIAAVDTFVEIQIQIVPIINQIQNIEELDEKLVGADMGLNNLIMLSNRKKIEPPKYLRKLEKRLAIEQRKLSKKRLEEKEIEAIDKKESKKLKKEVRTKKKIKICSKNREKQIVKVQKVHRRIKNQRRNFSHEVSRTLVDNFDLIIFEKLNIQQMMSNHHYAKSIADASWYQIQTFTSYKAEWAGKMTDFVIAKNSTKECSKCHKINDMPIWIRTMVCSCGNIEDRDVDSSFVIRDRSSIYQELKRKVREKERLVGMQCPDLKPLERMTSTQSNEQVDSMNQETRQKRTVARFDDSTKQALSFSMPAGS